MQSERLQVLAHQHPRHIYIHESNPIRIIPSNAVNELQLEL